MDAATQPIQKDLLLVGGGHSHAIVLRMFGMNPMPGVRITLISEASDTPYSGMLPGHVAGFYRREECHINLRSLCQFASAQFIVDHVIGLDLIDQRVQCANHPDVAFDWVSIDIGSTPKLPNMIDRRSIGAKPIGAFLNWWDQLLETPRTELTLGIVGGGTGGVELALNMQRRLQEKIESTTIHLFQRDRELMPNHNAWVRRHFQKLLIDQGVQLHLETPVDSVDEGVIAGVQCDAIVWVTEATAPRWIAQSGLSVDQNGFVLVNDALRSISHAAVFAAGDIATMIDHPRPKAGVFAVRQGKPLFENLCRAFKNQPLKPYRPSTLR